MHFYIQLHFCECFRCRCSLQCFDAVVGWQEGHPAGMKLEWCGAGMVVCLERSADLHMAQLMLLPLTISCFSKIQIGFTFLLPAHPGSRGQRPVKQLFRCPWFQPVNS